MEIDAIDKYTIVHGLYGFLAKKYGFSISEILIFAAIYEIVEPTIILKMKNGTNTLNWDNESKKNIIMDILAAYIGAKLAQ